MATSFTHAFVGIILSPLGSRSVSRRRLALTLAVLAVLPDLDVVAFRLGIPYGHPLGHRGLSHSLLFALALGAVTVPILFSKIPRFSRDWWTLFALCSIATASHGILDAMTHGGLGVGFLLPFSDVRFFLPWRPLAVSPIGLQAFFSGPVLAILMNEVLWIWCPLMAGIALLRLRRL